MFALSIFLPPEAIIVLILSILMEVEDVDCRVLKVTVPMVPLPIGMMNFLFIRFARPEILAESELIFFMGYREK